MVGAQPGGGRPPARLAPDRGAPPDQRGQGAPVQALTDPDKADQHHFPERTVTDSPRLAARSTAWQTRGSLAVTPRQREVSMRRRHAAALAIPPLLAVVALAGGASASASAASAPAGSAMPAGYSASPSADTDKLVTVTGAFGKAPKVKIPAGPGSGTLYIKTVIKGTGTKLTRAESLIGDFALYY